MCGITLFVGSDPSEDISGKRKHFLELSKKIRHRGPDWNGIYIDNENKVVITHERLSIVGVENGSQPIIDNDEYILSVNGEIYNHKELYSTVLHNKYTPQTKSDCEVIIYLYKEFGEECSKMLDGVFSFVLYDKVDKKVLISRDPIGVIPLYYGFTKNNSLMVSSEMKVLTEDCEQLVVEFMPGNNMMFRVEGKMELDYQITEYYKPNWLKYPTYNDFPDSIKDLEAQIRDSLTEAVSKRLMADVPFGVLLSGGLDSSLVASITSKLLKTKGSSWGNDLHTFSIGLKGAPDLIMARKVADYLGTIHHEYHFTVQEGIDCLEELIYNLETYDVTTIRASTPMYLMSRRIKSLGIKMVLSGEGADEILGGYLYFHNAPSNDGFHKECIRRVQGLHNFDCLRANKSTMSWGLEARVPFLDKSLMELLIPIHPELKHDYRFKVETKKIEKYILRKAFDTGSYLPDDVLWRQKEQFSDGVGYSWVDGLKAYVDTQVSNEEFSSLIEKAKEDKTYVPKSKEELFYRRIFDKLYPKNGDIVPRWIPNMEWAGVNYDPSGRAQTIHNDTTEK